MLTNDDIERYQRQMIIEEIGMEGQAKLKEARVFIAGAGGLGSPIAIYLAVAGVGALCIVDHDKVTLNNLNRQVLYSEEDIGSPKTESAHRKLHELNSTTTIETVPETLTQANIAELATGFDVIVDAMDNLPTRLLLNQAAISNGIPLVHGAVEGFEGRVMTVIPGQSACLKCMYSGPIPAKTIPVIGVTPGVIGAIQATEVIKHITGEGELLAGRMLRYDGLTLKFEEFTVKRNTVCDACGHL